MPKMMRIAVKEKKEKRPKERMAKPASNLDFDALEPAIVGDPPQVVTTSTLVLKRSRREDDLITLCSIRENKNGCVVLWDQTLGQTFMFNLNTDVTMKDHLKIYDPTKTCKKPRKPKPKPESNFVVDPTLQTEDEE